MSEEERLERYTGRTQIGHQNRQARSKRAAEGKINIKKSKCKSCGHKKAIAYTNENSPYQGQRKCTKCGKKTKK